MKVAFNQFIVIVGATVLLACLFMPSGDRMRGGLGKRVVVSVDAAGDRTKYTTSMEKTECKR